MFDSIRLAIVEVDEDLSHHDRGDRMCLLLVAPLLILDATILDRLLILVG